MMDTRSAAAAAKPTGSRRGDATATILQVALELGEELGFDALTIEGIAARTGVAKTTIYRRWPNVAAIVMDAFLTEVTRAAPIQKRATARESFGLSMKLLVRAYNGQQGRIMRSLLGRAQVDSRLLEAMRLRWVEPRREIARDIVREAIAQGELRPGLNPDIVLDLLYGPIYHRLLIPYIGSDITDDFIDALLETVFDGLSA